MAISLKFALFISFAAIASTDNYVIYDYLNKPHWYTPFKPEPSEKQRASSLKLINPQTIPKYKIKGNLDKFNLALKRQIARCGKQNPSQTWQFGSKTVSRKKWCIETSQAFLKLADDSRNFNDLLTKAKNYFNWYKSTGTEGNGKVLFTGYYIPLLHGSRKPTSNYKYPLYKKPDDLIRVNNKWVKINNDGSYSPYWDRYDIDWNHALYKKNLEIVYVDSLIDAFFLHIQGSGAIMIEDQNGDQKRILVNYSAQNGHRYVSIGRILKDEGADPYYYTSLQGLEEYFLNFPSEMNRIFPKNPSYVFFQEDLNGPFGANGTLLVEGHSIAIDNNFFPFGTLALISFKEPVVKNGEIINWVDTLRFMTAQDAGGAIKGPGRVDVFWGEGDFAKLAAGNQNHHGEIFFAVVP